MRRKYAYGFAAVGIGAAIAATALPPATANERLPSAAVKVELADGHGSAVYIGNGLFVTAGHVADDAKGKPVIIRTADKKTRPAEVLWSNGDYDLALLRAADPGQIDAADLSCRSPIMGENIYAEGNPFNVDFVRTYGHVAGAARKAGPWRDVLVTDMAVIPGVSGGPVYDQDSKVVGIVVGVMTPAIGISPSLSGIGYVVPASDVCLLMGREAA